MKILILTERFYPEEFLINDLAKEWKSNGHKVEVLTQVPSYPFDKVFEGYENNLFQTTYKLNGIPAHRVRTILGYNESLFRKILNYLFFLLSTSIWALFKGWKYDRVFIYHTGPLTMATAGVVLHYIWRRKCMIWTQDLWPDAVYAYGIKQSRIKEFWLNNLIKLIYSACNVITVSSPSFIDKLSKYTKKQISFIPQWSLLEHNEVLTTSVKSAKKIFTFAGNIGSVQNLDTVLEAFLELKPENAELRIVGNGVYLEKLMEIANQKPNNNVVFYGRRPQKEMPRLFAESDFMIISLKEEFSLTIPAKFQAYLAAGKSIFGIIKGDTAKLIQQYNLGIAVELDKESIMNGFISLINSTDEQIDCWNKNSTKISDELFARDKNISMCTKLLIE